jgi:hypothetical protein
MAKKVERAILYVWNIQDFGSFMCHLYVVSVFFFEIFIASFRCRLVIFVLSLFFSPILPMFLDIGSHLTLKMKSKPKNSEKRWYWRNMCRNKIASTDCCWSKWYFVKLWVHILFYFYFYSVSLKFHHVRKV